MVASFDDLENQQQNDDNAKSESTVIPSGSQESSGYTEGKVLKKGQHVTYNDVKAEISHVNNDGTVDVQELESPGKDVNGNELAPRWHGSIDPSGVEV